MAKTLHRNLVAIGTQWGDEGKGRIIDLLAKRAEVVVRFQGGPNAGHTLVVGDEKLVLHIVPSGILHPHTVCIIGNGVVVDPVILLGEIEMLRKGGHLQGYGRLWISDRAQVILPQARALEEALEIALGKEAVGTTRKGIGQTYALKALRLGFTMGEMLLAYTDPSAFTAMLELRLGLVNKMVRGLGGKEVPFHQVFELCHKSAEQLNPMVVNLPALARRNGRIQSAIRDGLVLFEGAQGTLLDIDHGTYPMVTSSNTIAPAAQVGAAGLWKGQNAHDRLGIVKAYTTRVGNGPFPTKIPADDPRGARLQKVGGEVGATTGRDRDCGWLDVPALLYAKQLNRLGMLAVTKLDVLSGLKTILVCTAYRLDGKVIDEYPSTAAELARVEPVYQEFPGWNEDITGCRRFEDLPENAQKYLHFIGLKLRLPIEFVSVGPERDQIIMSNRWK